MLRPEDLFLLGLLATQVLAVVAYDWWLNRKQER